MCSHSLGVAIFLFKEFTERPIFLQNLSIFEHFYRILNFCIKIFERKFFKETDERTMTKILLNLGSHCLYDLQRPSGVGKICASHCTMNPPRQIGLVGRWRAAICLNGKWRLLILRWPIILQFPEVQLISAISST